jgi:transposase
LCIFQENPFDGSFFVFRNKNGESLRIICYDGQGYWLCQKRLSKGKFRNWPKVGDGEKLCIQSSELAALICGGEFQKVKPLPLWKKFA